MKIYLFSNERLYKFVLPSIVEGNYTFDIDDDNEYKLINVAAKEGKWYITSTEGVNIFQGNTPAASLPLEHNKYYILQRKDKNYLIYSSSIKEDKINMYTLGSTPITIGNTDRCNANFIPPIQGDYELKISRQKRGITLETINNAYVYINGVKFNGSAVYINNGDEITFFGLKIIFVNKMLLMNNVSNSFKFNNNFGITLYSPKPDEEAKNLQIMDKSLYSENDFYSKSPRFKRIIETKKIKLCQPPSEKFSEELPFLLTIGPMMTMGIMAMTNALQVLIKLKQKTTTVADSWPQLVTSFAMLASMLLWPLVTRAYNKHMKAKKRKELIEKYTEYLKEKEKEVANVAELQKSILIENIISTNDCLNMIFQKSIGFWDRRVEQNDFLTVRIGIGSEKLDLELQYPDKEFDVDEDVLRTKADRMVERYRNINNVPVGYSFYENKITSVMTIDKQKCYNFINNILIQLLSFYSYEDLKIVIFTDEKHKHQWEFVKFLFHNFNNEKTIRYFASDKETTKFLANYMGSLVNYKKEQGPQDVPVKPYYLIITDNYEEIKRYGFTKTLFETDDNIGFSTIIISDKLSKLPSKCNNFILLGNDSNGMVLQNSYEKQEFKEFRDEVIPNIDMMSVAKVTSNIPIEFEEGDGYLPDAISFLEMLKVGKVEQLNILNKWNLNDSTLSLKTEIGVDNTGDPMFLDIHEKAHGPHGLIAGTTGSGKSEFIITYILSMCVNYSPDDVAFILIDYKGGGLALAFENKTTGVRLPHLAGTITNLDKAEMDRTLVSIDSETKRRQAIFNETRDKLGESTIDIYKYQRFYKEGKVDEPIPHLLIICDEFAELKAQQPDFMDNLISVARIGRSLGIHLILATQKPSGVVNDQIWSNTRFRVCLKVQDEQDSKEMLKRPEAAMIKQAGRYYLQVGYDEYFAAGQSGWCGAKYYPSDKIVKQVDKSINFIDDNGQFIKSIQAANGQKIAAQGEQLQAVMKMIISTANKLGKQAKRLWLDNIEENIYVDNVEGKYQIAKTSISPYAIIGEYDAPEKQEQGIVIYNLLTDGNTAIYGNDGSEKEQLLSTIIYSTSKNFSAEEINIYALDYGSESLRSFQALPQMGGMVFNGEEEKYINLIKMIQEEINYRKQLFVDYGGEYTSYIKNSGKKLPVILFIVNNYDAIYESIPSSYDDFPDLTRDSERYGIIFIFTGNAVNSIHNRILTNLNNIYALKLKDKADYSMLFDVRSKLVPRDIFGRGIIKDENVLHEFQTCKIADDNTQNDFIQAFVQKQREINNVSAKKIPTLPDVVSYRYIESKVNNLQNVPIGINKQNLKIVTFDFLNNIGNLILSNKVDNTSVFARSLLTVFKSIPDVQVIIIDITKTLNISSDDFPFYYQNIEVIDSMCDYVQELIDTKSNQQGVILIHNLSKLINKLNDNNKMVNLMKKLKEYEKISLIATNDYMKIKNIQFEQFFNGNFSLNDGIWIGRGISDQNVLRISSLTKSMTKDIKNDMGFAIEENIASMCKLIDFETEEDSHGK